MPAYLTYPGHEFFKAYLNLRFRVLREPLGLPKGSEEDEADHYPETRNLAWVDDDEVIGCVQLQKTDVPGLGRVRYMAIAPDRQGQGTGAQLLSVLEELAFEEGYQELYLHARENALEFYKACGYALGEEIAPFYGIRHWMMRKRLG